MYHTQDQIRNLESKAQLSVFLKDFLKFENVIFLISLMNLVTGKSSLSAESITFEKVLELEIGVGVKGQSPMT